MNLKVYKAQDFRPSRPSVQIPLVTRYRTRFSADVKIVPEFEDSAASKFFRAPLEIDLESPDSDLPYIPDWRPAIFDDKPDGLYQVEIVDVFGASYFVRPCYASVMQFLQGIKTPCGCLILTGLAGSGVSVCGYVVFAKLLLQERTKPEGVTDRLFVFIDQKEKCWIFGWVGMKNAFSRLSTTKVLLVELRLCILQKSSQLFRTKARSLQDPLDSVKF